MSDSHRSLTDDMYNRQVTLREFMTVQVYPCADPELG